jgi:hypothetical protein
MSFFHVHVTGMDLFIGVLLFGYIIARGRIHRHMQAKRRLP